MAMAAMMAMIATTIISSISVKPFFIPVPPIFQLLAPLSIDPSNLGLRRFTSLQIAQSPITPLENHAIHVPAITCEQKRYMAGWKCHRTPHIVAQVEGR
jgi:hypothetical protein